MPLVTKWRNMPVTVQWATVCAVMSCIIAGLVIALLAFVTAGDASSSARSTANCVNNVLGDRNASTQDDAAAHLAYAAAGKAFDSALVAVLTAPPKSQQQLAAYRAFIAASRTKAVADGRYVTVLGTDQAIRRDHPLGKC